MDGLKVIEMKPIWIVENFSRGRDVEDLMAEITNQGFKLHEVGLSGVVETHTFDYYNNQCVIFYGSINMTERAKKELPTCSPVVWLTKENYKCSKYYPHFKGLLFNDLHEFTVVKNIKENFFDFYSKYGKEALIFIRPDDGDKSFKGQLLDLQDFNRFWDNNICCVAKDEDLVLVSTPKNINMEARYVVDKYKGIIACSTYSYQGKMTYIPSAPVGATRKCEEVLERGYHPDSVYTIDICEDSDGNFWLMELNSWSSAGMYECNKKKIVERISEIATKEYLNSK